MPAGVEAGLDRGGAEALRRLFAWARPQAPLLALALLLGLAASAADVARAYLIKPVVDDVVLPHGSLVAPATLARWLPEAKRPAEVAPEGLAPPDRTSPRPGGERRGLDDVDREALTDRIETNLVRVVLLFAALALLLPLLELLRDYATAFALGRSHVAMKRAACAKLLSLPLAYHRDARRGDLVTRVVQDVDSAHSGLETFFAGALQNLLHVAVGAAVLLAISWQLSLLALIGGPLLFWTLSSFGRRVRTSASQRQQQLAELSQRLLEILQGIQVVKAFRAERAEQAAYAHQTAELFRRSMLVVRQRLVSRALVDFLNQSLTLGGLSLGAWLLIRGSWGLTPGDLVAFFLVANQSYQPLKRLSQTFTGVMDAQAGAQRFLDLLEAADEEPDAPGALTPAARPHRVALRNVHFSYDGVPLLRGVDFALEPGETVALVGRSGAGKSTIAELLLRLREPDRGRVEVDGHDLRSLRRGAWLARTALVSQEAFLFDTSIRENLRYGRPRASDAEILAAARAARVDEFAGRLPDGLDTRVGASGTRLSGGERQRITIARALLRDPGLLILDEATSALDAHSEKFVQEALAALLGGRRTTLVIAHRLSTIVRADRVVVLEEGRIAQQGAHAQLATRPGPYRELFEPQRDPRAPAPA